MTHAAAAAPTIGSARRAGVRQLATAGSESAGLDARLLLERALGWSATQLLVAEHDPLAADAFDTYQDLLLRRAGGEPVAHILGHREFMGHDFVVTPDTLIPRPDSEAIVEAALANVDDPNASLRVVDLGTGSGCLLIAVLRERPGATGVGVDRSAGAVRVAARNAARLGVAERACFVQGDWAAALATGSVDLVLANPPYIPSDDVTMLSRDVRDYEPHAALDGGPDGLDAWRDILDCMGRILRPGGRAVGEFGYDQKMAVAALVKDHPQLAVDRFLSDIGGRDRGVVLRRHGG